MHDQDKPAGLLGQIPREAGRLPPVHLWNPPFCGDIEMRIARDGTWFYKDSPVQRPALVRLFSSILRREGGRYFLVTPVEKVGIEVEDVPFVATRLEVMGQGEAQVLRFFTQVDDEIDVGGEHPLRVEIDPVTGEPSPYVVVRSGLEALLVRSVFYELVELAVPRLIDGQEWLGVWSAGMFFPLGRT